MYSVDRMQGFSPDRKGQVQEGKNTKNWAVEKSHYGLPGQVVNHS